MLANWSWNETRCLKPERCKAYTSKKEQGFTLDMCLRKNDTSYEYVEGRDGRTKQRNFAGSRLRL